MSNRLKKPYICLICLALAAALTMGAAAAPLAFGDVAAEVAGNNLQVKINALTMAAIRSNGTIAEAQNALYQLSSGLSSIAGNLAASGDAIGIAAGNGLSLTASYISMQAKSIDISQTDIDIYELQFKEADAKITNAAQSLLPVLARLDIGMARAGRGAKLLEDALAAKKVAADRGLATATDVLAAEVDILKLKAEISAMEATKTRLVMQLNTLLGRPYADGLELAALPEPDYARMDGADLAADVAAAQAASRDIAILRKEYSAIKTKNAEGDEIPSAVRQRQAKQLEIEQTGSRLAMGMTALSADIAAKRQALTALEAAEKLARQQAEQAAAKYAAGRITRLENDAAAEAALVAVGDAADAKAELFWMIETYKWAVSGLMPQAQ